MPEIPQFILERARANAGVFTSDEVAEWPAGLLDQLVASGVLRAEQHAKTIMCDSCGDDHVEVVQYIESPPGTRLRAYIPCPQLGRVSVPMARLRCWSVDVSMLPLGADSRRSKSVEHRSDRRKPPTNRSWTQRDLDAAIREYKAKRSSTYRDLAEGVKAGRPGAMKAAREMFGRNALARALSVKAPAMVTNSPEWHAIAEELRLPHGRNRNRGGSQKVGLDIAIESEASKNAHVGLAVAVQNETIRLIRSSVPQSEASALVEKLQAGDVTDDEARAIVEVVKDQKRDNRRRKARSSP